MKTRNYHHIQVQIPEGWSDEITLSISGAETLRLTPGAPPGCMVVFLPEVNLPTTDPEEVLGEFVLGHTTGRTIISRSEVTLGTTDGGLLFATEQVLSQGDDDWYCMYWALGTGEHVQCMVALASSQAGYEALLPAIGELVDAVSVHV